MDHIEGGGVKRIYASHSGTGSAVNNIANSLVPADGHILGVDWNVAVSTLVSGLVTVELELSYSQANSIGLNDQAYALSTYATGVSFSTSGEAQLYVGKFNPLPGIPVMAGTFVYLHGKVTSGASALIYASLYYNFMTAVVMMPIRR